MLGLYLTVFLSWVAHILIKMTNAAKRHKKDFSVATYLKDPVNSLYIGVSSITAVVLVLGIDFSNAKQINIWGIVFETSYLIAIAVGFMSASFVREIIKRFNPKEKISNKNN